MQAVFLQSKLKILAIPLSLLKTLSSNLATREGEWRLNVNSDFAVARQFLEKAEQSLCGRDTASRQLREAIELLVEAVLTAEHTAPRGEVVMFPAQKRSNIR